MFGIRTMKKTGAVFAALCCMLAGLCMPSVFAAGDAAGSVSFVCQLDEIKLEGMQWDLYLVAVRNENYYEYAEQYAQMVRAALPDKPDISEPNVYRTVGQFEGTAVMLKEPDDPSMTDAAGTLENEAVVRQYTPDRTLYADENGAVVFDNLAQGLYLLSGKRLEHGAFTVVPAPMLIEIVQDSHHNNLQIEPEPKMQRRSRSDGDSAYTVCKVWEDDKGYEPDRPAFITVNVYKDGELFDTVTLSGENDWRKTWYGAADAEWRVEEAAVPEHYTVVYLSNETQYLIRNTFTPWYDSSSSNEEWRTKDDPNETTMTTLTETTAVQTGSGTTASDDSRTTAGSNATGTTTSTTAKGGGSASGGGSSGGAAGGSGGGGKLPQTGQLWWPVPLMSAGGILFILLGRRTLRREEEA